MYDLLGLCAPTKIIRFKIKVAKHYTHIFIIFWETAILLLKVISCNLNFDHGNDLTQLIRKQSSAVMAVDEGASETETSHNERETNGTSIKYGGGELDG